MHLAPNCARITTMVCMRDNFALVPVDSACKNGQFATTQSAHFFIQLIDMLIQLFHFINMGWKRYFNAIYCIEKTTSSDISHHPLWLELFSGQQCQFRQFRSLVSHTFLYSKTQKLSFSPKMSHTHGLFKCVSSVQQV